MNHTVGLEVNTGKTKNILMPGQQNAPLNHDINTSFENVAKFKYLRTTVTIQNLIHEEITSRMNSGNACCHSDQKFCPLIRCLKTQKLKYI
jgi:hypothetical protein